MTLRDAIRQAGLHPTPAQLKAAARRTKPVAGPKAARPRRARAKTPEGQALRAILHGLASLHIPRWRIGVGAFRVGSRFVKMGTAGLPDVVALVPGGGVLFIEVKSATGRLSTEQREFQAACADAGVTHLVARSWDDVEQRLRMRGAA